MPYDITTEHDQCDGFGVVKPDGELMGCHDSQAAAERQLAALYANEPEAQMNKYFDEVLLPRFRQHLHNQVVAKYATPVQVIKADGKKQIVTGVVLRPQYKDSHGDVVSEQDVERAAHKWMIQSQQADWNHETPLDKLEAIVVESYINPKTYTTPNGDKILKGDWIASFYVPNKDRWDAIERGEIQAFSIMGRARRVPA